jgi:hypothetical protein
MPQLSFYSRKERCTLRCCTLLVALVVGWTKQNAKPKRKARTAELGQTGQTQRAFMYFPF